MISEPIQAELRGVLEVFNAPAALLSTDYEVLAGNRRYHKEFAYKLTPGKIAHCYEISHHYTVPCDQAGEDCPLRLVRETGQPSRMLHLHHTARGEEHVDVEIYPLFNADGKVHYYLEVMRSSRLASQTPGAGALLGRSPAFNKVVGLVERVAPSEATVLLLGESGTGKELIASAVHDASLRSGGPFVPVECSGLTETLFESELFGHEKGAFTGAVSRKVGLVEAARGGTLFLDEIGDVPLSLQVKLLRLLETGTYRRVGGIEPQKADFRLICATHRGLKEMVDRGEFRQDLYYRLNTFPIELPPLRQRLEDLPLLIDALLHRFAPEREIKLSREVLGYLRAYPFPGNIRELRNMIERALLLADGDIILPEHLPPECRESPQHHAEPSPFPEELVSLEKAEARYLRWAIARFHGEKRQLAQKLGVSERTLYRKLSELGLTAPR
ncbi:MAG: sigma-54-dependent Fis family transcriptional regulator [Gammaproteobacteria bacterium]|nr:sigma-54-dependent Fis family transcriptional regulator [Gammaproteobacteria bacterium]MCW8839725.1 sigma-54-dependent Fis family transcriptional regulator [Gammaproteobacteria bacterium]MCW8959086.1 sigma-54-dependent Fis family transcriptional regulator [Gammaproteobacteria bacterium]MCW8994157.1 sigma-54-dependent Fis family transcriptional regulator [Gammaproteobacteria bacterium]